MGKYVVLSITKSADDLLVLDDRTPAASSIPCTRKWARLLFSLIVGVEVDKIRNKFSSFAGGRRNKGRSESGRVEG
jgi:hypothetical protein